MKLYRWLPLIVAVLLSTVNIFSQKFPYEEYDPRTLSDLVQQSAEGINEYKEKQMMIDAKPFYSAVRVTYVGTSRPLTADKKMLYQMWQGSLTIDPKILALVENEYLVKECDKEYWVTVQKQVAGYFPKELKTGDRITLYLMVVGGVKTTDKWDFIFLVNEFRKY